MQLKHIKLAGFKSFVDPTRISFPTNMVAVVGPNGCGKSNIIDAVRWVLGELSAKNLRGDSMSDVIFNGSEQRKPSGQCSIELLFDNSSGKVGGEYAAFNEISVKRVMTRDSQSSYFINNTKCRRKDVQDIFLGTGLGPSSYAIIEQGMVSSLVSAKPEELRTHIEEAAGVSKYRERRKETESRIKKTKENLSRVNDIRDEIGRLIRRLESQAKAADRYKDYKNQEKEKELNVAILFSLDARDKRDLLNNNLAALQKDESVKESEVSVKQAKLDQYKTEHESVLSKYEDAQKKFYEVGSEIARFEQNLQNIRTTKDNTTRELERVKAAYEDALEKASDFENLSPKEKALHLIDEIISKISSPEINSKAEQLKDILLSIFNIVLRQSKEISDEYLNQQENLETELKRTTQSSKEISTKLQELIETSASAEAELNSIRKDQQEVDAEIRRLENEKSVSLLDLKAIQEKITNTKIEISSHSVHLENSSKRISESGIDINDIDRANYQDLSIEELQSELETIRSKIIRLGAINLAAPDEIAEERKRKDELDKQNEDLEEALEKLNKAISQIDKETKEKFIESFDAVNKRLKSIFPIMFGGGNAELSLTDNSYLNAGVKLMARPPGKKNSTLSQLSGGEKAMTALALVFALFELNPAPFCLLDEVDAPLDDLNTSRFINMVEEMSKKIQFIFITHNKVSMEKSDHLMGVTMQEAGVSRVVSVDVNQAVEFAAQ